MAVPVAVSESYGRYYAQTAAGNTFIGSTTTAGIALVAAQTTGLHPTLWNPTGSGVNCSLLKLTLGYVSGTPVCGSPVWSYTLGAGSAAATAAPIPTFTKVAPVNALLGVGRSSKAYWAPATNTFTAAPTYFKESGIMCYAAITSSALPPSIVTQEYDGSLVVPPGVALSLTYSVATSTALFIVSLMWQEIAIEV